MHHCVELQISSSTTCTQSLAVWEHDTQRNNVDKIYWWHNALLVDPELLQFHYPFKAEYGSVSDHVRERVAPWIGRRVLELGAGTGWLRNAWAVADYTGVERGLFGEPFQKTARLRAESNGVLLGKTVSEFAAAANDPYDTVICYESWHAFPAEVLRVLGSSLLRPGGTAILVDAARWLPRRLRLADLSLRGVAHETMPDGLFDFDAVARLSLDTFEALQREGYACEEILAVARTCMQPEIYHPLRMGVDPAFLRGRLPHVDLTPEGFGYTWLVFEKSSRQA